MEHMGLNPSSSQRYEIFTALYVLVCKYMGIFITRSH